jgi:hypothetical protein
MYPPLRYRIEDNRIELYQTRSESYAAFGEAKIWSGKDPVGRRSGGAKISARPGRSNLLGHTAPEPLRGRGCSQCARIQTPGVAKPSIDATPSPRLKSGAISSRVVATSSTRRDLRPTVRFKRMSSRRESRERSCVLFALSIFARRSRSHEKLVTDPETDPGAFAIRLRQGGHR